MKKILIRNQNYVVMAGQAKSLYTIVGPKVTAPRLSKVLGINSAYSVMAGQAKAMYSPRLNFA
jgi:hypothetical protein